MKTIDSETDFQAWLADRLAGVGDYQDHRLSHMPHIPDMSYASGGLDYWIELKYQRFNLGHDRYDRFEWDTLTAGQLYWLKERAKHGSAECGVLGYMNTGVQNYICFMTPAQYVAWYGASCGAVLLTPLAKPFRWDITGPQLMGWLIAAARCRQRPST